jgi:hypothetical protein
MKLLLRLALILTKNNLESVLTAFIAMSLERCLALNLLQPGVEV